MKPFLPKKYLTTMKLVSSTLGDGTVRLNGTYFSTIYENQQITVGRVIDGQPTADIINANEADLAGLEFELAAQLSDNWTLTMTYGLLDGEYNDFGVVDTLMIQQRLCLQMF